MLLLHAVLETTQRRRDHRRGQLLPVQLRGSEPNGRGWGHRGRLRDLPRRRWRDALLRRPGLY